MGYPLIWLTSRCKLLPSAFTNQTPRVSQFGSPRVDTMAILLPSGDHIGKPIATWGSVSKVIGRETPLIKSRTQILLCIASVPARRSCHRKPPNVILHPETAGDEIPTAVHIGVIQRSFSVCHLNGGGAVQARCPQVHGGQVNRGALAA